MLEKPDIPDTAILACLREEYGVLARALEFLPLGADLNTAVYRAEAQTGEAFFLKLRSGDFLPGSVSIPKYLSDMGSRHVIPPLPTRSGNLMGSLPPFKAILHPFVEGRHAYESKLPPETWVEFGAALRQFHDGEIPSALTRDLPREDFSPRWREAIRAYLGQVQTATYEEPVAAELAAFLREKQGETLALITRAEQLARELTAEPPPYILCHGDIHGWNLLIDRRGQLFIVDWDTLIHAPRERDLMFIGAGLADSGYSPLEEEAMFYKGYGTIRIHRPALAYYRFERIIEDIAAYCDQILSSTDGGADREQGLEYLRSNYLPGNTIERAWHADI